MSRLVDSTRSKETPYKNKMKLKIDESQFFKQLSTITFINASIPEAENYNQAQEITVCVELNRMTILDNEE